MTQLTPIATTILAGLLACTLSVESVATVHDRAWKHFAPKDTLPIPGPLSQSQIDRYYPNLLDTMRRVISVGAEPIDLDNTYGYQVSMLHNTGTFD